MTQGNVGFAPRTPRLGRSPRPRARRTASPRSALPLVFAILFVILAILHFPLLRLPYFWDEAGYYVPAAVDFYRHGLLIPRLTLPDGHTPLLLAYLSLFWRSFGFSPLVARVAMLSIAAATAAATFAMGRRLAGRELGGWAAALLVLSPLFFAQSSLVYPGMAVALFTTLTVFFTLDRRWGLVALAASLAVLSKETAVILLPATWAFLLWRAHERRKKVWALTLAPLALLLLWALYYHAKTGFWTGNAKYLQYNFYSDLRLPHLAGSLLARVAEVFVQGFNWVVVAGAAAGIWWKRTRRPGGNPPDPSRRSVVESEFGDFLFLAAALAGTYIVFLTVVSGAMLSRYVLPLLPVFYVSGATLIARLPRRAVRLLCLAAAVCFVASWFVNPPYPDFSYDDNLAYANFVRLHQRAAGFLESLPHDPVILSAWPATDELKRPFLGYVTRPLRVASVDNFAPDALANPPRFGVLYLYSRKWEPGGWMGGIPLLRAAGLLYGYQPPVLPAALVSRFHLTLLKQFQDRGQWVKIYRAPSDRGVPPAPPGSGASEKENSK